MVFDTYESSDKFNEFISKEVPDGHIVVAACKDDCVKNLSTEGKNWFTKLGSKEIWDLQYRHGFAFIGISGRKEAHDKRSMREEEPVSVTQIFQVNIDVGQKWSASAMSSEVEEIESHNFDDEEPSGIPESSQFNINNLNLKSPCKGQLWKRGKIEGLQTSKTA